MRWVVRERSGELLDGFVDCAQGPQHVAQPVVGFGVRVGQCQSLAQCRKDGLDVAARKLQRGQHDANSRGNRKVARRTQAPLVGLIGVPRIPQREYQAYVRRKKRRLQFDRAVKARQRLVEPALVAHETSQIAVRQRRSGIGLDCPCVGIARLPGTAERRKHIAQVAERRGIAGFQRKGPVVAFERACVRTDTRMHGAQGIPGFELLRLYGDERLEHALGPRQITELEQYRTEQIVRGRGFLVGRHRASQRGHRVAKIPLPVHHRPQVQKRSGIDGPCGLRRAFETVARRIEFAGAQEYGAEIAVGRRRLGIEFDRL